MRRTTVVAPLAVLAFAYVASRPAGAQELLQQKLAAAMENAAQNPQALGSYGGIEKVELSLKGEVNNTAVNSCRYGPDGKVQKTAVVEPEPPHHSRSALLDVSQESSRVPVLVIQLTRNAL